MKTIAVLLDSDLNKSLLVLEGIREELSSKPNIHSIAVNHDQISMLESLLAVGGVDGIIGAFPGDRWLEHFVDRSVPLVNIGSMSEISSVPTVAVDYDAAGSLAARYFIDNGWISTAVIFERTVFSSLEMCKSFIKVASESGNTAFEIPDDIISSDSIRLGEWLAMLPVPVACFCTSDYLARRVANAFINIGREIPESAGVLGVGDSLLNSVLAPQMLSSIVLPEREIGRTAASLIIEMFNEPKTVPISWKLPPTRIITRESTAIARYRDEVVNNAISYMMTHLFSMSGIEELAHICGVSKRNLEARFKNVLGRAPAQEWRQRRHREVCRLLSETNISLGDIARMSGYAEPSNFWNAFKKLEGITPARYRASNR